MLLIRKFSEDDSWTFSCADLGRSYPPFMERQSGHVAQQRVWEETKSELVGKVPELQQVYDMLGA